MRSIALRLGVIGAIVIGALLLRPYLSGNAGNLQVGDCFDEPAGAQETISDVQHRPCTDPHGAEVVFVGDFTPDSDDLPGDEQFIAFFNSTCASAFNEYTGLDFVTDPTYDMDMYFPTLEGWNDDNREVICFAIRLDGAQMASSIKKP
ncbi:MAG TPA: septum formation family protein [Candidatus Limnocylindria bacterium]|nr:septum formation family protein [Candidatus Limnocylindria bacterium]